MTPGDATVTPVQDTATEATERSLTPVRLTLRFYPGPDDDLLRWLDALDAERHGTKNQAVKDTLRLALGTGLSPDRGSVAGPNRSTDDKAILAEVRKVVEAAISSALGRFVHAGQGAVNGPGTTAMMEDGDEVEDLLETLDQALVLGEEDL